MLRDGQHTTNYLDTFILVADDCPAHQGEVPAQSLSKPTIAWMQFDLLSKHPYKFTSDDVLFRIFAERNDIPKSNHTAARTEMFSKGQACFRSSPLGKRYGWGVHADSKGRIAIYGMETAEYKRLAADPAIAKVKAMRSKRA